MSTRQQAVTATAGVTAHQNGRGAVWVLARLEAARLARHPFFVVATLLLIVFIVMVLREQAAQATTDSLSMPVVAITVGLGAMVAAYRLTRSFHKASELTETAPTPLTTRTGALCAMVAAPVLVAVIDVVFYYGFTPPAGEVPDWMYGVFSRSDVALVILGNSVVAAAGGTLLGVAAGRWWRFPGAAAALFIAVSFWTLGVLGAFSSGEVGLSAWQRWVRLFTPVGLFTTAPENTNAVSSLTGSPAWYLVWLVTLCALATIAALLWRSEGQTRRRLVRLGAVALALSALVYVLAAGGGLGQVVRTFPDGHSVVLEP